MTFKIVSVGWKCAGLWERTVQSIEDQSVDNWEVWISYDGGDDAGPDIQKWCDDHGPRWNVTVNAEQRFAVRNQVEAIQALDPADDDIIVFLDLDGDQLAHDDVLAHLADAYADDTLVTYGSYQPMPASATCAPAVPFPPDVVKAASYRQHILSGKSCCFNHLRTMKGRVFKAIPPDQFKWVDGRWYQGGTDYIFMIAALELAGGRYKCLPETLLIYNHANPNADNKSHPAEASAAATDYLRRPPLKPLGSGTLIQPTATGDPFLPASERREILRDYGHRYGLRVFVETGTANGDTPATLAKDFDRLYTIEVGDAPYRAAMRRFAGTNVICLHGDSTDQLPKVLAEIGDQPALFWLDGHMSGGDHGDKDTPLMEELAAIFATKVPHVVLIDDARLLGGMSHFGEWDWPHVDEVTSLAMSSGYDYEIEDDIIRMTPSCG